MQDVVKDVETFTFLAVVIGLHLFFSGLQTSNKASGYPVRMDNSVPLVPQNQSSQSLHIQPGMLTQVGPTQVEFPRRVTLYGQKVAGSFTDQALLLPPIIVVFMIYFYDM